MARHKTVKTWENGEIRMRIRVISFDEIDSFALIPNLKKGYMKKWWYCGYVGFPKRPFETEGYMEGIVSHVPVHGGITFAEEADGYYWYGFDTNHSCDCSLDSPTWDIEWVISEMEYFRMNLLIAQKYESRYLNATEEERLKVVDDFRNECRTWRKLYSM